MIGPMSGSNQEGMVGPVCLHRYRQHSSRDCFHMTEWRAFSHFSFILAVLLCSITLGRRPGSLIKTDSLSNAGRQKPRFHIERRSGKLWLRGEDVSCNSAGRQKKNLLAKCLREGRAVKESTPLNSLFECTQAVLD